MGQRSQIYARITDKNGKKYLIAKYYQWNYGERIISRARYSIEYIKNSMNYISLDSVMEQFSNIINVNFDMKDYLLGIDIIKEWLIYGKKWENEFKEYVFENQDNNDGKLFIDINEKDKTIKYCLTDYNLKIFNSPKQYMDWDCESWNNSTSEYYDKEIEDICIKNFKVIEENAELMTNEELEEFINDDYTEFLTKKQDKIKKEIEYLKGGI